MKYPTRRDMENATFDGAVYQLINAADDGVNLSWKFSNCASGSRCPRVHRMLAKTIKFLALLLFSLRRVPNGYKVKP